MASLYLFTLTSAFAFSLNASCSLEFLSLSQGPLPHFLPGFVFIRFGEPNPRTDSVCFSLLFYRVWWGGFFWEGWGFVSLVGWVFCL